jgi:hypothetical protein
MSWLWIPAVALMGIFCGATAVWFGVVRPARLRMKRFVDWTGTVDDRVQHVLALTILHLSEPHMSMLIGRIHDGLGDQTLHAVQQRANFILQSGQSGS